MEIRIRYTVKPKKTKQKTFYVIYFVLRKTIIVITNV